MTIAYKGFNQDLQGYGKFQYKVGETYELDGELEICENGFHYCKRIVDVGRYYNLRYSRVCEVEVLGNEVTDDCGKFITDRIRIVRELSQEEINKYFEDNWKELIKDEDFWVRIAVVKRGFGLDILVFDENWNVRLIVARMGFGLDILVKDENWVVRYEVVKHGRPDDLDILVYDKDWVVRKEVAMHGRPQDLDILVYDEHWRVRMEVARHGREEDLDILVHDEHWAVKEDVTKYRR